MLRIGINDLNKLLKEYNVQRLIHPLDENRIPNIIDITVHYICPPEFGDWKDKEDFCYIPKRNKIVSDDSRIGSDSWEEVIEKDNDSWEKVIETANNPEQMVIIYAEVKDDVNMFDMNQALSELEARR